MDDARVLWIKHVVYRNFNLTSDRVFDDFLERDDGIYGSELENFLDGTVEAPNNVAIFTIRQVKQTIFEEIIIPLSPEGMEVFSIVQNRKWK